MRPEIEVCSTSLFASSAYAGRRNSALSCSFQSVVFPFPFLEFLFFRLTLPLFFSVIYFFLTLRPFVRFVQASIASMKSAWFPGLFLPRMAAYGGNTPLPVFVLLYKVHSWHVWPSFLDAKFKFPSILWGLS